MNYYETYKEDLLTKEQRMQFNRISDVVNEAGEFLHDIWDTLDHDVTDTLDDDGAEMYNFQDDLKTFIFGWVMGEKMVEIEAIKDSITDKNK